MDKARIAQLTDTVMAQIIDDVRSGIVPWTVTNFEQLHDWVDANMYLEHAGQQFDASNQDSLDEVIAIEDEVSERLTNGVLNGGGWRRATWTVQQTHRMVLPLALLPQHDGPLTPDEAGHDAIAAFEGDTTHVSSADRTITRMEVADAPAYVEPPRRASILDGPRVKLRAALAELRRLDADVRRPSDHHDGFESPRDEVADQANRQARTALQLALALLGMTPAQPPDSATREVHAVGLTDESSTSE